MARVIWVTGRLADTPYHIEKIERDIFSIEELCYSLVQSAQFLDDSIMDPELIVWIDRELGLPELAKKLRPMLGKKRLLSEFVNTILQTVGYVSQDKQLRTRQIVASGQGMEPYERRLDRADYLSASGHSYEAIGAYEGILNDLPEPERRMRLEVLDKIGRVYARLFRFHTAAEYFSRAYELSGSRQEFVLYLAATRFSLSDAEYVSFISEHPECYSASLELERKVREGNEAYEESGPAGQVARLRRYHDNAQMTNYEIALQNAIQDLKEDYRIAKAPSV